MHLCPYIIQSQNKKIKIKIYNLQKPEQQQQQQKKSKGYTYVLMHLTFQLSTYTHTGLNIMLSQPLCEMCFSPYQASSAICCSNMHAQLECLKVKIKVNSLAHQSHFLLPKPAPKWEEVLIFTFAKFTWLTLSSMVVNTKF